MFLSSLFYKLLSPKFTEEKRGFIDRNPEYILVDNKKTFKQMLFILEQASSCIIDTEADSMYHYEEKLSLIQISVGKYHWLLDPLCKLNLKPLWKCKALKNITFHACDYDLRLLSKFYGFYPKQIYDTSMAAKLLGEKQTGLAALVEKHFGIKLDKGNQKADWTKRPLTSEMCRYAMLDTVYLEALKEIQLKKLSELNRLEWLQECCENFLKKNKKNRDEYSENKKESWRLKGSNGFKPLELQLLRAAWNWRDKQAENKDVASYRILNPYLMLDIIKAAAKVKGKITENNLPRLPRNIKGTLLAGFLEELNKASIAPVSEFPTAIKRKAAIRTAINEDLREKLYELRNKKAEELNIEVGLLAKQNQLNILADALHKTWENKFEIAEFMNWQKKIWQELTAQATLPQTSEELRAWAKDRLKRMSEEAKVKESEELCFELAKHSGLEQGYIAAFYPTKNEPQIIPFLNKLATENRLLLPRVLNEQTMEFVLVNNLEQDLNLGILGIAEPKKSLPAFDGLPGAFVVPGIIFNKNGARMGRGKGYYDRFLAPFKSILKIGVAYSVQIRNSLPQNATDIKMNEVLYIKN